jgi:hypothetical protein
LVDVKRRFRAGSGARIPPASRLAAAGSRSG